MHKCDYCIYQGDNSHGNIILLRHLHKLGRWTDHRLVLLLRRHLLHGCLAANDLLLLLLCLKSGVMADRCVYHEGKHNHAKQGDCKQDRTVPVIVCSIIFKQYMRYVIEEVHCRQTIQDKHISSRLHHICEKHKRHCRIHITLMHADREHENTDDQHTADICIFRLCLFAAEIYKCCCDHDQKDKDRTPGLIA